MITTGFPYAEARKTEMVDVANGLTCSDLAEFPEELYRAVGANLGGTPVYMRRSRFFTTKLRQML